MKLFKLMALAAISMPLLFSCQKSGGSSSDSLLFGPLPGYFEQITAENEKLQEEMQNMKSESEAVELLKKAEESKEAWTTKIEESAKALNGKPIEFAENNFKMTEPLSLEFVKFFSKIEMTPEFKVNGKAEAASDINLGINFVIPRESVYIVGYDAQGQQAYKIQVGSIVVENVDGQAVIKAGTPVEFYELHMVDEKAAKYKAATSLKLEALR